VIAQSGPPDTSAYYHIAYIWVVVVYAGYSLLLWIRGRGMKQQIRRRFASQDDTP
jgi:hypothetical protein